MPARREEGGLRGLAPSVAVLRAYGALDLREVTRLTAIRFGASVMYADVDAVLQREREEGRVVLVADAADYRNRIWKASPSAHRENGSVDERLFGLGELAWSPSSGLETKAGRKAILDV